MRKKLNPGTSLQLDPPLQLEPDFTGPPLENQTVPEGRDVMLSCTVKNLQKHKASVVKDIIDLHDMYL